MLRVAFLLPLFVLVAVGLRDTPVDPFLAFPQREDLAAAPGKSVVAWVQYQQGVSNVWVADLNRPDIPPKPVTSFTQDNGLGISSLTFSFDGQWLFFTQSPQGGRTNPTYQISPPVSSIIAVNVNTTQLVVLMTGARLGAVSPDRIAVTFAIGSSVFEAGPSLPPTKLFALTTGSAGDFEWHPSGRSLALANDRGDHALIVVFTRGNETLQYVSPSFDADELPHWSPDGNYLAFRRYEPLDPAIDDVDRSRNFSILIAPTNNLAAAVTVYSDTKAGVPSPSAYGVRDLLWASNDRLVFPSETSGFVHLLATDQSGVVDLTPLACENQDWATRGDGWIYLSHNCDREDSMGISRVHVQNASRERLVLGDVHVVAGMAGGGYGMLPVAGGLIFVQTSWNVSSEVWLRYDSGTLRRLSTGNGDPSGFTEPVDVTFPSQDGKFTLHGQLFRPAHCVGSAAKCPAVVYTHGGPMRQSYAAFHFGLAYHQLYALNQYLAYRGAVVLSINYRLGVGYGRAFRICSDCKWMGAREYTDLLAGYEWLAKQDYVDLRHVGVHGLSFGGWMTNQALARNSSIFSVGVTNAGVLNYATQSRFDGSILFDYVPPLSGTLGRGPMPGVAGPDWNRAVDERVRQAWESSAASHINKWTSPVLIIHADQDGDVAFDESLSLLRLLQSKGDVEVKTLMFPDEMHGSAARHGTLVSHYQASADFLISHLTN